MCPAQVKASNEGAIVACLPRPAHNHDSRQGWDSCTKSKGPAVGGASGPWRTACQPIPREGGQVRPPLSYSESPGELSLKSPRTLALTCSTLQQANLFHLVSSGTQHAWPLCITQFWPCSSSALVRSSNPICRKTLLGVLSQEYGSSVPQSLILPCSPPPPPPHIEFRG